MLRSWIVAVLVAGAVCVGRVSLAAEDDAKALGSDGHNHTFERAGYPQEISKLAAPSVTPAYIGYLVGGGSTIKAVGPGPIDGTWGWDYSGCKIQRHVVLGWCFRYQGGMGAYRTDGKHVPNVFAIKLPSQSHGGGEH